MEILILGHKGLLGNMVKLYFDRCTISTKTVPGGYRWESIEFKDFIKNNKFDFIINCIGAIHQKTKNFSINYELPIWLDSNSQSKIIHPGTDCETDDNEYGVSKKIARDFIVNNSLNTKSIKTSIIGTEVDSCYSLMSWFLSNPDYSEVNGFSKQMWNGNTTLTWARFCLDLINNWENYQKETILYSECVSKYEVLSCINNTFGRKIKIVPSEFTPMDKCLNGDIKTPHISIQIKELKKFLQDENN
jgi:dTDP-4-dehydrorhamnose reductase